MAKNTHDYKTKGVGERAGSASAVQMPAQACKRVLIRANGNNAGNVYIGFASTVSVPNETSDLTSGYPLEATESLELFVGNLDQIWYICDAAGDAFSFLWEG